MTRVADLVMVQIPDPSFDPADEHYTRGLLERLLAGDRDAAEELFASHYERLRLSIHPYFRADLRGVIEQDELLQRALLRALLSLERFEWRGKGAFLAWLKRIALNVLRSEIQARSREHPASSAVQTGPDDPFDALPAREPTPSAGLVQREEEERLIAALHSLSEEERDLITNRRVLGQDYESLATDMGITVGAVRTKLSRALARVTKRIEHRG